MMRRTRIGLIVGLVVTATVALTMVAIGQDGETSAESPAAEPAEKTLPRQTGQHGHTFRGKSETDLAGRYLLFIPEQYGQEDMSWPLIVFLHGSGERGNNLNAVKKLGVPKEAPGQPGFPFLVLSPQCPKDKWWSDVDITLTVMGMIDEVVENYDVDPGRIYLTGLSMGGFGTWDLAQKYPDKFAAIAPVCGWGNVYMQDRLKNVPAWVFHGAKDPNVPLGFAKQMAGALKSLGGDAQLSVYPGMGHNIWTVTYRNPKLYEWFLSHRRDVPKPDSE
jgi:predicted peptidase